MPVPLKLVMIYFNQCPLWKTFFVDLRPFLLSAVKMLKNLEKFIILNKILFSTQLFHSQGLQSIKTNWKFILFPGCITLFINVLFKTFMHNVVKWSDISKFCGGNTARFLKYVCLICNIMHERVICLVICYWYIFIVKMIFPVISNNFFLFGISKNAFQKILEKIMTQK